VRGTVRIALLLATSTGGIGRHVLSLAAGLVHRGDQVIVYGPAATQRLFDFTATGAGFAPVEIPTGPGPQDLAARAELRRALRANPPDLLHAHGLRAGLVTSWARASTPLVVTWHNMVLGGGVRAAAGRLAQRAVARAADVTLGVSSDLVAAAVAAGAADARFGPVAAPPLPAPARTPAAVRDEFGVPDGAPVVLSVGRLHPQKRYDVLIAAAARWRTRTPPPVVLIAGSGPDYLPLAAQASAQRAPVTLLGHRSDIADLLGAADLAVTTSAWEARQLFAQEALLAGVPLVATGVGGVPELVGDAAVLVPAGDVDALDAAVVELLDAPDRRAALARRGRQVAAGWPTEEQTVDQIRSVYAELLPGPAGTPHAMGDAASPGDGAS
jgi:glycosyltransferase involved in cell wall biosynthesis